MSADLLSISSLAACAGDHRVIERVTLDVPAGKLIALKGPSGCGKTTLLRAIAALDDPADGEVRLEGRTPAELGYPLFRRRCPLVQQQPVLAEATVRENLARVFHYESAGDSTYDEKLARELLEALRVEPSRYEQDARSLSVGQQQRVCLVRALLMGPKVLLLDEPTSALDADAVWATADMLRRFADERNLSALIVAHDVGRLAGVLDDVIDLAEAASLNAPPREDENG
ncbi:MAG: ABC transporter ATP-binding protein [Planctomycetota bacterium]